MNSPFWQVSLVVVFIVLSLSSCSSDEAQPSNLPPLDLTTIWTGPTITFEKAVSADPNDAANQDRITNSVWITRGNMGQIYNAASEGFADKETSPEGTLWAVGTTANLQNLSFNTFRGTLDKPRNAVGTNLVLLLVSENIAIDVRLTSWISNGGGGFSYERSSN
ncbi:MAG: hypothetical protein AAF598_12710 [Bacteroidota bacterium]